MVSRPRYDDLNSQAFLTTMRSPAPRAASDLSCVFKDVPTKELGYSNDESRPDLRSVRDRRTEMTTAEPRRMPSRVFGLLERMPLRNQIIIALIPYALTIGVLFAFVTSGGAAPQTQPPASPETQPTLRVAATAPIVAPQVTLAPTQAAEPSLIRTARVLPVSASLFVRPNAKSRRAAWLDAGTTIEILEGFDAPTNWRLVQTSRATIGFLLQARLQGEPAPIRKKRRRRRR